MDIVNLFTLTGKTAIVTGGARGNGRSIAHTLAQLGADVAVADVDVDQARVVGNEIEEMGQRTLPLKVNVANESDCLQMASATVEKFGKIDILVNNAGVIQRVSGYDTCLGITIEDWERVMAINLTGALLCARAVLPHMIERRHGAIINITSIITKWGGVNIGAAYGASKAGLAHLTKSLAVQGAPHGIRVNAVAPHAIDAGMTMDQSPETRRYIAESTLIGRLGTPEEVAYVVAFLASEAASFIIGQTLHVNGGTLMID